ncbi:MAG: DMT family transporter [Anaerolineales bacterium]|nr:DMT family transporter [Anaerolineales bacterium]MCX7608326.1 DMT family transporter [Anaerolineales bacterium]MDW8227355.1 EamA family transporter [Anaerolineales bacterium]
MLTIVYGLASALVWGAGDFTGGIVSRKTDAPRAVLFGGGAGLFYLLVAAILTDAPRPDLPALLWSAAAGAVGMTGLLLLYHAFAVGQISLAAPISALLSAALPIVVGLWWEGLPELPNLAGFGLALAAIWLISSHGSAKQNKQVRWRDLGPAFLSGIFFGLYFIFMERGSQQTALWPMVTSRAAGILVVLTYMSFAHRPFLPPRSVWPLIALNGLLDVTGNGLYVLAAQVGRLDIAAVLGSLYPASTVFLARLFLHERLTPAQARGVFLAFLAIVLMTI